MSLVMSYNKHTAHVHETVIHDPQAAVEVYQLLRIEPEDGGLSGTEDIELDFHIPPSQTHTCTEKQRACQERRCPHLFSSYLEVCVVNMLEYQGRRPGLK